MEQERNQSENMSRENAELSAKLQRFETLSIKHVELVRKAEEFSAQNGELADQVEQFSEQNVQMRREIEKLDAVVADYAAQVATLKSEVEQKRTELENVRKASAREASDLRRELAMKDSEVFELRRRHDDDDDNATTLESQLRSLQSTLSQKEADCHQLKARLTSLFKTFTQLLATHSISCDGKLRKFFSFFPKFVKYQKFVPS